MTSEVRETLLTLGRVSIESLEVERGILASAREEIYGCIFGRDSLITALALLRVYEKQPDEYFLALVRKILQHISDLQGKDTNIQSGEEPGKIIHEYRPDNHERLTKDLAEPWYVYPDSTMRNYDSIDSTPLYLMTMYAYWRASNDETFMRDFLPHSNAALGWLMAATQTTEGFISYQFHPERTYGGLKTQSWMDSGESLFFETANTAPIYPIAPVEAQAYAYAALRNWSDYHATRDAEYAAQLSAHAQSLKEKFNAKFVIKRRGSLHLAFAIDGAGRLLTSPRSSMGHVLWAVHSSSDQADSILSQEYIEPLVKRLLAADLFVPGAGIRTLSSHSSHFAANSYHNGSIWPHDTAIVAHGMENFGYVDEAARVRSSLIAAYSHFRTPVELFTYSRKRFGEYSDDQGQGACRTQAWSAASLLSIL